MIFKNAIFGNTQYVTVCEFGTGTIKMVQSKPKDGTVNLYLKTQEPEPIGLVQEHSYKSIDDMKPEVVLMFKNIESLNAVILTLQELKEGLQTK